MDLLKSQSDADQNAEKPAEPDDGAEQKPDINQYFKDEYGAAPNSDQKSDVKPSKPSAPKAFDVFSPGKTTPSASSRPIIVSHKAMAKDTTVTGNQEVLKQEHKEATAPQQEHRQMLDTHKKVNLKPMDDVSGGDNPETGHTEHWDEGQSKISNLPKINPPEFDQTPGSETPDVHNQPENEPQGETTKPEQKHDEPSPAFSAPEHTDTIPAAAESKQEDELLIPAHTGEGYNEPVQDSEEQFNQFVVSHHKTARQKWLKKFGVIFVVVLVVAAAVGFYFWKMSS